jgi:hypothetical protein
MAAGFLVKTRPGCPTDFRLLVQAALLSGARYDQLCRLAVRDYNPVQAPSPCEKGKSARAAAGRLKGSSANVRLGSKVPF